MDRKTKPRHASRTTLTLLIIALLSGMRLAAKPAQVPSRSASSAQSGSQGQALFTASCASCHGLDGRGGERAPGIVNSVRVQRMSDADVSAIISDGIPDTGMPAFRSLTTGQVSAIVGYLRLLQGREKPEPLPGDPARGKAIFFGKGECSSCHMMRGEGGLLGPDLSSYGSVRSAKEISDMLRDAGRIPDPAYRIAVATLRNGQKLSGIIRNEDNFSVQLQSTDGAFHFLSRTDLKSLEYQRDPAMPRNYGERLQKSELDDLVSYIVSVGRQTKPDFASQDEDRHEED